LFYLDLRNTPNPPSPDNQRWLQAIHPKSIPLMLPDDQSTLDAWLAPPNEDVNQSDQEVPAD